LRDKGTCIAVNFYRPKAARLEPPNFYDEVFVYGQKADLIGNLAAFCDVVRQIK